MNLVMQRCLPVVMLTGFVAKQLRRDARIKLANGTALKIIQSFSWMLCRFQKFSNIGFNFLYFLLQTAYSQRQDATEMFNLPLWFYDHDNTTICYYQSVITFIKLFLFMSTIFRGWKRHLKKVIILLTLQKKRKKKKVKLIQYTIWVCSFIKWTCKQNNCDV